jgi:hypothetical protein
MRKKYRKDLLESREQPVRQSLVIQDKVYPRELRAKSGNRGIIPGADSILVKTI